MPKFIVEAQYQDEPEAFSFGHEFSTDDLAFRTEYLDVCDELFVAKDVLADIKSITAAEDIDESVSEGDIVWRDWADVDTMTVDARKHAIQLALGSKMLWRDRGPDFDALVEILCPQDWEVEHYGLTEADGYILPDKD